MYIDVEESKIKPGKEQFTESDVREAIRRFISQNRTRLLKPLLDMIDLDTGQDIHTPKTALSELYLSLRKTYF